MKNIQINWGSVAMTLSAILLLLFTLVHGIGLLTGDENRFLSYMNIISKEPLGNIKSGQIFFFKGIGGAALITAGLFLLALVKGETLFLKNTSILKWAVFMTICTVSLYGLLLRTVSNQQGSALLFFFTMLLYLVFEWIEKSDGQRLSSLLNTVVLFPLFFVLFYTMGLPGWAKIFGGEVVIAKYVGMFKNSFLSSLPGGIPFMIYILGVAELLVPVLLIISLVKGEFRKSVPKRWLNYALILAAFTFTMLCFGLSVIFNFAGSANLVFYAIFTLLIFLYVNRPQTTDIT